MSKALALVLSAVLALSACGPGSSPDAENGATVLSLDAAKVPQDLRHLVPLAEQWGIGDDVDRYAKVERADAAERQALRSAVRPHDRRITEWLDSFGEGLMSDEAAAFMYMLIAIEEMEPIVSS